MMEQPQRLISVEKLAELLDLAPGTVCLWARQRKIPHVRLGSRILFSEKDVAWIIDHNRVAAVGAGVGSDAEDAQAARRTARVAETALHDGRMG
jgi:excisionase family DNA binding protein